MSPASDSKSTTYDPAGPSSYDPNPPTIAAFSPNTLSESSIASKQRSTIVVHKKSPLLVATPPQVTRALAYSHPFLLPLNKLAGLLSWTSGDPWESVLMVCGFWAVVLYGSKIILWAGPVIVVVGLILGMYSRRYSPLSSTTQTGEKHGHKREASESCSRQNKSLDEIVETLHVFTSRCNLLLDPFLRMTDFLSTQRTATSATTRPALTALFIRILLVTPIWILLTLPPFYILTTHRVVLVFGTMILTWHSRPVKVSRVILWRSMTVRRACSIITGLSFSTDPDATPLTSAKSDDRPSLPPRPRSKSQQNAATDVAKKRRPDSSGVRFTFILYENQRRWLGVGWTYSLLAYERAAWTDEHLNPASSINEFELPDVEGGQARWRWIDGSQWRIEGGSARQNSKVTSGTKGVDENDGGGWIYYDNKWNDGRRGVDSWGRYTRRRKWYRDAELVEVTPSTEVTPSPTPNLQSNTDQAVFSEAENDEIGKAMVDGASSGPADTDAQSTKSVKQRKGWFSGSKKSKDRRDSKSSGSMKSGAGTTKSGESVRTDPEDDHFDRWKDRSVDVGSGRGDWGLGEDVAIGLS
ncbi:MAG: hypothetical protein Q9160_001403 [Pyrenula sp. 1 TL-2023]